MSDSKTTVGHISLWDRDRDGGALEHVEMLARETRHTRPGDRWFNHAEKMGWAVKVTGVMSHPWHRVMLTKAGASAIEDRKART